MNTANPRSGPVALRRRLRNELRRARITANLTQKDIADRLDWSPSKIIRLESGAVAVSIPDLRALLTEYGISDAALIGEFEGMARASKRQPYSQYKDIFPQSLITLMGYESAASTIRNFELIAVPGLLQTEDYTRDLLLRGYDIPADRVERIIEARLERQELLDQADAPHLHFIIDEAAIRRVVGGSTVMEAQLNHISEQAKRASITVQVIPFPAGPHRGMSGPLIYLEFSDPAVDDIAYIEGPHDTDAVIRDDPEITAQYLDLFLDLEKIACRPDELDDYLGRAIDRLPPAHPEELHSDSQ